MHSCTGGKINDYQGNMVSEIPSKIHVKGICNEIFMIISKFCQWYHLNSHCHLKIDFGILGSST